MGSIDDNYRLIEDAKELREIQSKYENISIEYESLKTKYEILEHAVCQHRQQIGVAYGVGSFKTQHAANIALWKLVKPNSLLTAAVDKVKKVTGLARPAMMEETE